MTSYSAESVRHLLNSVGITKAEGQVGVCADRLDAGTNNYWIVDHATIAAQRADHERVDQAGRELPNQAREQDHCNFPLYVIDVSFEALPPGNQREHLLNLPTTFRLPDKDVTLIIEKAGEILRTNSAYEKLMFQLHQQQ